MATYVLLIDLAENSDITIGAKGGVLLDAGRYAYVGSAKKAWEKRIARHCRKEKKKRWHIDYILADPAASVGAVMLSMEDKECETCRELLTIAGVMIAHSGIGSSDCRCPAHFLRLDEGFSAIRENLGRSGFKAAPQYSGTGT